ncbi:signal transduction histidine kinase [Sulfuricella denitrificans skB26]|uniref:histidine kinase n=1 Tax=Sulfuricella denitrificans (strain DSM 22764 / NBRC 105220 / skB26) TaxID=1163617 RepID=S6AAN6_SULDS|nr:sensor histidine kinase [Sulfuricella denitrificans]BAN36115.1 signal transduction histidine kinase [Sulfuricella denitrificans skB26]
MKSGHSLRQLLLGWLLPPLVLLLVAGAITAYQITLSAATQAYDRALLDGALALAKQIRVENGQTVLDLPLIAQQVLLTDKYDHIYYLVQGSHGEFIAGHRGLPLPEEKPLEENRIYYDGFFHGEKVRIAALFIPSETGQVHVLMGETLVKRNKLIWEILLGMLAPQVLLVAATIGLVWFGVKRGLAPIERLRNEIAARSQHDLRPVQGEQAPTEVQPMVEALNTLLEKLGTVMGAQQRFISDAAHQLRTPLAALQAQVDLALHQKNDGDLRLTLQHLFAATERTVHLANQLLTLARAEPAGHLPGEMQPVDLSQIAQECAEEWVPRALVKNIDLGFELEPARIIGIPLLIRELLANLLDNAIRYTPVGGNITVRTIAQAHASVLEVEDNGPGIPTSDTDAVFERFYRIKGSPGDGCGLGLAIVREIARTHSALAESKIPPTGQGTLMRAIFPVLPDSLPDTPT